MKALKILKLELLILLLFLSVNCGGLNLNPKVFKTQTCDFTDKIGKKIYCNDTESDGLTCFNAKEIALIEKMLNKCDNS